MVRQLLLICAIGAVPLSAAAASESATAPGAQPRSSQAASSQLLVTQPQGPVWVVQGSAPQGPVWVVQVERPAKPLG